MKCALLENFLYEAREEARTHLCAAERRASSGALRLSSIKIHGFLESLRSCVSSVGVADSLCVLAQSLARYVQFTPFFFI